MNQKEHVLVVTTGGTIEKSYCEENGQLSNRASIVKVSIIDKLRLPYTDISYYSVLGKDSLNISDDDRELLYRFIRSLLEQQSPIVIVHGTDTMEVSARYCYERLIDGDSDLEVPVIFTGAMKPGGFDDSDARQNVTEALLAAKLLSPGVYISFHGRVFEVPQVRKNRDKGTFEEFN